jgi:RND family efflux transporter MFP subunit
MRSRRGLAWIGVAAVIGIGATAAGCGGTSASTETPSVVATRGPLVLQVGGIGRIVQVGQSATASSTSGSQGSGSTAAETPGFTVYARTSGNIQQLFAAPGKKVRAGQALAVLDDGGVAAAAISQAENDLAAAQVELRQKRTSDPLKGIPPTAAELAAARLAVTSARARLQRLQSPPRKADLQAARLDVERAEADLETLRGGSSAARADALLLARQNVQLAQARLDRIQAPPRAADVAAAQADVRRTEAELAAQSFRTDRPALPSEIAAARAAVDAARARLAQVQAPADSSDVTAAQLELERARADLRRLEAGPSPQGLQAALQAVAAAKARLAQLLSPPLASDVTAARLDVRRAQADLAVLQARSGPSSATDIALARLKVQAAEARLASARQAARPLTVRSPYAGTVTALLTSLGARVDPSLPIVTLADLDRLEASVDLSEFDVAQVEPGQKASISVDALGGETFPGKVLFAALSGTSSAGVVTFPVRVSILDAEDLKPGMNVGVKITVDRRNNVVQVPIDAVTVDDADRATVQVLDEAGEPTVRKVVLGLETTKNVEIVKGLKAGERVVLAESGGGAEEE